MKITIELDETDGCPDLDLLVPEDVFILHNHTKDKTVGTARVVEEKGGKINKDASDTISWFSEIRSVLDGFRGTGSTTALMNGAINTEECVVVVPSQAAADNLRELSGDGRGIIFSSLMSPDKMRGFRIPVLFDMASVMEIVRKGERALACLSGCCDEKTREIESLRNEIAALKARIARSSLGSEEISVKTGDVAIRMDKPEKGRASGERISVEKKEVAVRA